MQLHVMGQGSRADHAGVEAEDQQTSKDGEWNGHGWVRIRPAERAMQASSSTSC